MAVVLFKYPNERTDDCGILPHEYRPVNLVALASGALGSVWSTRPFISHSQSARL